MFQFRRFPTHTYFIQRTLYEYGSYGFPHSDIPGSSDICSSPRLFAACHVLLRLLMPRHSPCALIRLTLRPRGFRYLSHHAFASRSLAPPQFLGSLLNYASTLFYRSFAKCCFTLKVPQSIRFKCRFPAAPSVALLAFHSSVQFSRCRFRLETGTKYSKISP